jgi:hypothetical protein
VDTHEELKAAWRDIVRRKLPPQDLIELGRAPLSESAALQLAGEAWKDPEERNLRKIEWQSWAQRKYRKLMRPK